MEGNMSWESYEKAAEKGPMAIGVKIILLIFGLGIVMGLLGWGLGWFSEAGQVAQKEFGANAALQKYEWFIDQANRIDKMDQDIALFRNRLSSTEKQYSGYGKDMSKWPPHIQVQYNKDVGQSRDDMIAVISQRNNLVRDYNAQSQKFNWSPFETAEKKPQKSFKEFSE
jgi:hypothetical protein